MLLTNLQIAMKEEIKLVRLRKTTFAKLKDVKFDFRVDTFDEAVGKLIDVYQQKQELAA